MFFATMDSHIILLQKMTKRKASDTEFPPPLLLHTTNQCSQVNFDVGQLLSILVRRHETAPQLPEGLSHKFNVTRLGRTYKDQDTIKT